MLAIRGCGYFYLFYSYLLYLRLDVTFIGRVSPSAEVDAVPGMGLFSLFELKSSYSDGVKPTSVAPTSAFLLLLNLLFLNLELSGVSPA